MSSPPSAAGAPFSSAPIEPARRPGGCARGALIGCGSAAILVLLLFGAFTIYVRRKPEALTDLLVRQIESNFAKDVTEQEKADLHSAYADFRVALKERRVGQEPLDRLRAVATAGMSGPVGPDQVRELAASFRKASSSGARSSDGGASGSAPAPVLSPTP